MSIWKMGVNSTGDVGKCIEDRKNSCKNTYKSNRLKHVIPIIVPVVIFEEMIGKIKVYMKMQMI